MRVSAQASVEFEGDQVNVAWNHLRQSRAAADYLSEMPPGQIQSSNKNLTKNEEFSPIVHHLAILNFQVTSMDWLVLSKDGHRRARLTPSGIVHWLVP